MGTALGSIDIIYDDTSKELLVSSLRDLFEHRASGNFGEVLYRNGGAKLFEKILNQNYNPHHGEVALLNQERPEIADWANEMDTVIIVGGGPERSLNMKEIPLLKALPNLRKIISIELSPEFNRQSMGALKREFPNAEISSHQEDFRVADLSSEKYDKALVISTGSFTNFPNCSKESFPSKPLRDHISSFRNLAKSGGKILWCYGTDLDANGYNGQEISDFLLYPLRKAQENTSITIDPDGFVRKTEVCPQASMLAHDWVAIKDQVVFIDNEPFVISVGDRWNMFSSVRPDPVKVTSLSNPLGLSTAFIKRENGGAAAHAFDCM